MAKDRIESKYVTVAPGVELHILEKGEGKPLVFIPGLTFSGEIFKNQLEYFSSEYRVIAIDPRGQGYSAKTVDGNDYLTHGRDVAGLIDALGLKDIVLIGWSTGNLDTWSYVQQFGKDKLRGVVTIDMSPLPLSPDPKWWTEGTIEELSQVATQVLTSSEGCREFFSEYATGIMIQHKMEPAKRRVFKLIESVCAKRNCTTISCSVGEHQETLKLTKNAAYVNCKINKFYFYGSVLYGSYAISPVVSKKICLWRQKRTDRPACIFYEDFRTCLKPCICWLLRIGKSVLQALDSGSRY